MKKDDQRWTREQAIIAFNLYCKIPFNRVTSSHPELKKRGIVGLANASKLDEEIWNEFNSNWDDLVFESEKILSLSEGKDVLEKLPILDEEFHFAEGVEKERLVKTRVNQNFFRQAVLSAYDFSCCITGIDIPELLVASHIIPWSKASKDRLNPRNGLCLNALHDKAFDKGLMTVTPDFKIKISKKILAKPSVPVELWIASFEGKDIITPERFMPTRDFLEYHNKNIFQI